MIMIALSTSFLGLAVSIYGIIIEWKIQHNKRYKPSCDISDTISCSRAFLSPYGKILGISNIWAAAIYYVIMIIVTALEYKTVALLIAITGLFASIGFAYILYFKVKALCPICTALYAVNIVLAMACYFA